MRPDHLGAGTTWPFMRRGLVGLVAAAAACALHPSSMIPSETFRAAGIEWQRNWPGDRLMTRAQAHAYCESIFLGGVSWRLPTREELEALWNLRTTAPRIGHPELFWSSTPRDGETGKAARVLVNLRGIDTFVDLDEERFVRCVR